MNFNRSSGHDFNNNYHQQHYSGEEQYVSLSGVPSFGVVSDHQFGIHENAAILKKTVKYCTGGGSWSSISYNHRYNQEVQNDIYSAPVFLENFQLSSEYFSSVDPNTVLIPNYTQLLNFVNSQGQIDFRYIGNGVFYSEISPGYSPILRNELKSDTNGKLSDYKLRQLMNTCNGGDRYVKFTVYQPRHLSIEGKIHGNTVYPTSFYRRIFNSFDTRLPNILSYFSISEFDRSLLIFTMILMILYCFTKTVNKMLSFSIISISAGIGAYFIPSFIIPWSIAKFSLIAGIATFLILPSIV